MPVIACPHCRTKLNGPDSVLGKEVICGQCQKRFIASAEAPFGSQYARPEPPQASRQAGLESMAPPAPPAQEPGPATQPQQPGEPPQQPPPAQWQQPGQPEPSAPQPPRPAGVPQPPPIPGDYGPPPLPEQPYGPYRMLPPASGAGAAMVLGIISIAGCWCCWGVVGLICGGLAIVFGGNAMRDIDAGRADPNDRGKAVAGKVCGIIGLIISILVLILSIFWFAAGRGHWRTGWSSF